MAAYSSFTDQELTDLLKSGNEAAFAEVYKRYWSVLFLHARRMLGDSEEARDITQELFTGLWLKATTIEFANSLSSYLYKAVRNKVFDHLKHDKITNDYLKSLNEFLIAGELINDDEQRVKELAEIIEAEIRALPAKMRVVFELSRKQHLSYKEIAEQLGISEHTVKSQVSNALHILRAKVGATTAIVYYLMHR